MDILKRKLIIKPQVRERRLNGDDCGSCSVEEWGSGSKTMGCATSPHVAGREWTSVQYSPVLRGFGYVFHEFTDRDNYGRNSRILSFAIFS